MISAFIAALDRLRNKIDVIFISPSCLSFNNLLKFIPDCG